MTRAFTAFPDGVKQTLARPPERLIKKLGEHAPCWPVSGLVEAASAAFPGEAITQWLLTKAKVQHKGRISSTYRCGGSAAWSICRTVTVIRHMHTARQHRLTMCIQSCCFPFNCRMANPPSEHQPAHSK